MATKQQNAAKNAKNDTLARIKRTEAYAESVRVLFARCVNEMLALHKTLPKLGEGEMYSFDGDSIRVQRKVEELLRRLASAATLAVENGVKVEWEQANAASDALLQSCFGKKAMKDVHFSAWRKRNEGAMKAFQKRVDDGGFKLSDKIWKTTRQLREEMEIAMTLGIGEGESAADMSRKVRKYLNDPDLMFRRFRYKAGEKEVTDYDEDGNPIGTHTEVIYGRKWKKKVKGADGKTRWIDYDKDSYKVGTGNYKSSARNAMRVTRTETNMAYRESDQTRWQQMDFVMGVHIELSRSHPKKDICDKLAGDYPKDFKFEGWHPQCFCVMTPILMPEDEMLKMSQAMMKGETYVPKGKRVTSYPEGFKDWVTSHHDDIVEAHKKGTDPYFVRHNFAEVEKVWNPKKEKSPLEIAEERHAARTEEQVAEIKKRLAFRNKSKATATTLIKDFEDFGDVDTTALQEAYKRADWEAVRKEALPLLLKKREIIHESKKVQSFLNGIPDIQQTIDDAKKAIESGKLSEVQMKTNNLKLYQKWLQKVEYVENPVDAAKQVGLEAVININDSVKNKLDSWSGLSLSEQKTQLEKEIGKWADDKKYGLQSKYPNSWKISQDAYAKELEKVVYQIDVKQIEQQLSAVESWSALHPKSINVSTLLAEAKAAIANKEDIAYIKNKANLAIAIYQKRLAEQARRDAKKPRNAVTTTSFDDADYTQSAKDNAIWCQKATQSHKNWDADCEETWNNATAGEREAWRAYTGGSGHMNRPLRGYDYTKNGGYSRWSKENYVGVGKVDLNVEGGEQHIRDLYNLCERTRFNTNRWLQRGIETWDGVEGFFGVEGLTRAQLRGMVGREICDFAFMSCGSAKGTGFSGLILNIYCPRGTKGFYACNHSYFGDGENETILQAGTRFRILKVEAPDNPVWATCYVDIEVIGYVEHPSLK